MPYYGNCFHNRIDKDRKKRKRNGAGGVPNPLATTDPGGRDDIHISDVNTVLRDWALYMQGSVGNAAREHDLQLTVYQIPVLASGTPAFPDTQGDQIEPPLLEIIVDKAGHTFVSCRTDG